jgi:lipid II:glycine glycyltransferase (peptidoglycan interpeptide bridge formation enzyme)
MPQNVQFAAQPVKPDCLVWYAGDPCDVSIQQYHQAVAQLQQQEWQASVTAAVTKQVGEQQKQIAEQQRQIKALQSQITAQTSAALQSEAHTAAIFEGIGAASGVALALFLAVACFRWLARSSEALGSRL